MNRSKKLIKFLRNYNKWRRGDEKSEQPDPTELGKAIEDICNLVEELEKQLHDPKRVAGRN